MGEDRSCVGSVLLLQLPIPPLGLEPIRGNVPLAAGYLKLWAEKCGLGSFYDIQVWTAAELNSLGDRALVAEIVQRDPWMVGFTCYIWNVERTLWIARELKRRQPSVRIVIGGPEITADNAWVLNSEAYDFAVIGEGEQTFSDLLLALLDDETCPAIPIPGLYVPPPTGPRFDASRGPAFRTPIADLNALGSPYRAGILNAADERMLLMETIRGCRFRCKFCYYPKAYDKLYFTGTDSIRADLSHALERGVPEVVLLDPTLNQRKDFADFLRLLADGNPGRRFRYFGELRAEGITAEIATLLREANFTEVEIGLQSIEAETMTLMDRKNNLRAFERGVQALLHAGIKVKVDMIVGLPGDTVESVRRGFHYLRDSGLYSDIQAFHLSVLPGTAFRHEAAELGLRFQPRPPYYVLETPTLDAAEIFGLLEEAQDLFELEFDALPPPLLDGANWRIELDAIPEPATTGRQNQAFTIWLRSENFARQLPRAESLLRRFLRDDPFTTLQVVLEAKNSDKSDLCRSLNASVLSALLEACQEQPTYLDKYYAMHPGRLRGAKRLIVLLPEGLHCQLPGAWLSELNECASLVFANGPATPPYV